VSIVHFVSLSMQGINCMQSRSNNSEQWAIEAMCADGMIIVCFKQSCGAFELDSSESLQGILPQINPKLDLCADSRPSHGKLRNGGAGLHMGPLHCEHCKGFWLELMI
jgi:hypothetical protein